jgi:hypothetical protein
MEIMPSYWVGKMEKTDIIPLYAISEIFAEKPIPAG